MVELIVAGHTIRSAAAELALSPSAVKLGLTSRVQLVNALCALPPS